jgi:hypothetical protein
MRGRIVLRRKVSRGQLLQCVANLPICLIGLESCAGAHHVGRQLAAHGHDVRLLLRPGRRDELQTITVARIGMLEVRLTETSQEESLPGTPPLWLEAFTPTSPSPTEGLSCFDFCCEQRGVNRRRSFDPSQGRRNA